MRFEINRLHTRVLQVRGRYLMQSPRRWGGLVGKGGGTLGAGREAACATRSMVIAEPPTACERNLRLANEVGTAEDEVRSCCIFCGSIGGSLLSPPPDDTGRPKDRLIDTVGEGLEVRHNFRCRAPTCIIISQLAMKCVRFRLAALGPAPAEEFQGRCGSTCR